MSTDPFEQLRIVESPASPDPRFVARLRARVVAALEATALPTVPLQQRSTPMTETTTSAPAVTVTITPYICVAGATDALAWYAEALGAVETIRYTGDDGRIGHAEISIGGAQVMLSDEHPELGILSPTSLGGTPCSLHVTVPDVDAAHERAAAAGAHIERPPQDEAYGARSFTMRDPFGHRWMIQTPTADPSREEIEAAMTGYRITTPDEDATG